ncbi:MAG: hypothetical protein KBD06_01695 [Candidatus Pacebacteria bacterium]|nr:hypothetical protein [Candidatus Paceibacterota bacterium]
MSAESGPQAPKNDWDKVLLLKNAAGDLWYRTKSGEVVVLDEAAEDELSRQKNQPDTPPADGYPEFSKRLGTEELPVTDPSEVEKMRKDLDVFINNIVDIDTDTRTHFMEEMIAAEDGHDLEVLRAGIQQMLDEKAAAARAASGAAGAGTSTTPNPTKTPAEVYAEIKPQEKERLARKRAIEKAKRDAIAELDAEEAANNPPPAPKTPEELFAEKEAEETQRLQKKEIEERAKKRAREKIEAAAKAKTDAEAAVVFAAEKDYYTARFENLRRHGVLNDTNAILAEDEVAHTKTSEELKSRFDDELKGLELRLPENVPPPEAGINAINTNAEFSQLTQEAISNIEAIIEAGGNPNRTYESYRKRFRAADLKYFDAELQGREKAIGKSYDIDYGSMSPADRMRAKNPAPVLPSWAGNYLANTDGTRSWLTHKAEKYGDMHPFSIEEIRTDPKKDQLFGEFMTSVDHNNTILATIADGRPLDSAQQQLLEYCQYEFTYQHKRAEALAEMLTPDFIKQLMKHDDFMRSVTVMYGAEKTHAFLKEDVFNIAVRDRGTFDRLALAAWRLNRMGKESVFTNKSRGQEHAEMADVFADRLYDPKVQAALQSESVGGTKAGEALGGIHALAASEVSPQKLQELFDRDKMKEKINGRGWDKWTTTERNDYKSKWRPEEVIKSTDKKELGFFAQVKQAFMETLFAKSKKEVKAH